MFKSASRAFYKPLIQHHVLCAFNTSSVVLQIHKEAKFLKKLMVKSALKRKSYSFNTDGGLACSSKTVARIKGEPTKSGRKRVTVLNKLFMKHITDLMTTGDLSTLIHGRQIEISKVKVAQDFNLVNVFWIAKGVPDDVETEKILAGVAGTLWHELSQLKVIGIVPRIQFVKDKHFAKMMEMEIKLAKADFGEDFVPTDPSFLMKSEFTLNMNLNPSTVEKIHQLEAQEVVVNDIVIPPMRQDIFGLNREKLLGRVMQSMKKSREAWNKTSETDINNIDVQKFLPNQNDTHYISSKEQKHQFAMFLRKREIMKKKGEKLEADPPTIEEYDTNNDYDNFDAIDKYIKDEWVEESEDFKL